MSMKNSNDTIGNRTRDLPTCSAVPQPTAPPRAPIKSDISRSNITNLNLIRPIRGQRPAEWNSTQDTATSVCCVTGQHNLANQYLRGLCSTSIWSRNFTEEHDRPRLERSFIQAHRWNGNCTERMECQIACRLQWLKSEMTVLWIYSGMLLYQWVWVFLISSSINQLKMHTYLRSAFSYVLLMFTLYWRPFWIHQQVAICTNH